MGIDVAGASCSILDNDVIDTMPVGVGEAVGVAAVDGDHCVVSDNVIKNGESPAHGRQFGVWVGGNDGTQDVTVRGNTIIHTTYAFGSGIGSGLLLSRNTAWATTCAVLFDKPPLAIESNTIVGMSASLECPDQLDRQMPLALKGDAVAAFRVGIIYVEGMTETRNLALGYAWITIASERGNAEARRLVSKLPKDFPDAALSPDSEVTNDLRRQLGLHSSRQTSQK
jgi:Right handed beta helix region